MSVAYTRGIHGKDLGKGVLATAKHFVGYAVTFQEVARRSAVA